MKDARRISAAVLAIAAGMLATATLAQADPIQEPQRAQLRHFSFFHTEPEGLPGWSQKIEEMEKAEDTFPQAPFLRGCDGLNAELAQKIEGIPGRRIFVIPGDGCMEMVNQGPTSQPYPMTTGVSRNEEAIKHGMQTGGFRAGFGIVPDGAIAAKLSPTLTVPVVKGTFFTVRYRGLDVSKLWTKARLIFGASAGGASQAAAAGSAPQTTIQSGPGVARTDAETAKVRFAFSADGAGATFECSIDIQPYRPCRSPKAYRLRVGSHTFRVRAIVAGVRDPTPASKKFKVEKHDSGD